MAEQDFETRPDAHAEPDEMQYATPEGEGMGAVVWLAMAVLLFAILIAAFVVLNVF